MSIKVDESKSKTNHPGTNQAQSSAMRSSEYQPSSYSRDFEFKSQLTSNMRMEEQNLKLMKV